MDNARTFLITREHNPAKQPTVEYEQAFKEIYTRLHLETGAKRKDLEEDEREKFGREEKLPSTDQHGNEASNEADVLLASWTADVTYIVCNFNWLAGMLWCSDGRVRRVVFSLSFITSLLTAITGRHPLLVALVSLSSYILLKK
ncbi:hypothetical protein T02_13476 [Trichinella nativa]|uniref:Uncharacterized protein n=1 Tax=Trichinella nativa TaxID=6335 RepID=A0A0V1KP01_9BILA|nr:hypothetical protein T02_13476 [Trichinella nativa]